MSLELALTVAVPPTHTLEMITKRCGPMVMATGLLALGACSEHSRTDSSDTTVAAEGRSSSQIVLAYTSSDYKTQLASIVTGGVTSSKFHWVRFAFPAADAAQLSSDQGLVVDLADPLSNSAFSQVYPGPCNPAKNDFSTCFLYESYVAGQQGLIGTMTVHASGGIAAGSFDVTWEGVTDRFGAPSQEHQHETEGEFAAAIVDTTVAP